LVNAIFEFCYLSFRRETVVLENRILRLERAVLRLYRGYLLEGQPKAERLSADQ
jgi:hypothetical protein